MKMTSARAIFDYCQLQRESSLEAGKFWNSRDRFEPGDDHRLSEGPLSQSQLLGVML